MTYILVDADAYYICHFLGHFRHEMLVFRILPPSLPLFVTGHFSSDGRLTDYLQYGTATHLRSRTVGDAEASASRAFIEAKAMFDYICARLQIELPSYDGIYGDSPF